MSAPRNRRQENSSEFSATLSVAANRANTLETLLEDELAGSNLNQQLQRLLSFRTVISTSSSLAQAHQAAVEGAASFPEIGRGSVGKVFEHPGRTVCYKLPLTDEKQEYDKLFNNYQQQSVITASFEDFAYNHPQVGIEVSIPRAYFFATKASTGFWNENKDKFDWEGLPSLGQALCMERIFPVPNPLRELLIDKFCKPELREAAKAAPKNKQCLIRPMLGREGHGTSQIGFKLRNYALTVEKFRELDLPADEYAEAMAGAFAVLHWQANLDGYDIEFVLGSAPTQDTEYENSRRFTVKEARALRKDQETYTRVIGARNNFKRRVMSLWMLDFDSCKDITVDSTGTLAAVKAFKETYAYTPRPHATDAYQQRLWETFTNQYRYVSRLILPAHQHQLPELFIKEVTRDILQMRSRDPDGGAPRTPMSVQGSSSTSSLPHRPPPSFGAGPSSGQGHRRFGSLGAGPSSGQGYRRFGSLDESDRSGLGSAGPWRGSPIGSGSGNRSGGVQGSGGGREQGDSTGSPVRRERENVTPRGGRGFGSGSGFGSGGGREHGDSTGSPAGQGRGVVTPRGGRGPSSGFGSGGGREHGDSRGSPGSRERGGATPRGGQGRGSGSGDRRGRE
ncbi:hypothetical protein LTR17_012433 [Elasticomyces elasticus]|nr:hypothetical protein LTR17_012433 [Elasticomyces elasticus]